MGGRRAGIERPRLLELADLFFPIPLSKGRRMAKTQKERIGLVPAETLPGDKVVLIAGSSFPFILRLTSSSRYRLVGGSYIHDIMDGIG